MGNTMLRPPSLLLFASLLAAFGVSACCKAPDMGLSNELSGSVTSKGAELGDFVLTPTSCQSGQHYGFFGVDFFKDGSSQGQLRYIQDPVRGKVINVTIPGSTKALVLTSQECSKLEGNVQRQNSIVNSVHNVEGSVSFDCKYAEGKGHVKGDVKFKNCH